MSNRFVTPDEAAESLIERGHEVMSILFPSMAKDTPEYTDTIVKLLSACTYALFVG